MATDNITLTIAFGGFLVVAVTFVAAGIIGWISDRAFERSLRRGG